MTEPRAAWMSLLARAPADRLKSLWQDADADPSVQDLRRPEIGTAMVRGRAGATGAPFNLGEMTITRCSVELDCGTIGHAYVQGRDSDKARIAAIVDALMQTEAAPRLDAAVLAPLRADREATEAARAACAAATKVEFFTMVRGED